MENNSHSFNNENNYQDFYLIKNDIVYKIIIEKVINKVIIKSNNYCIKIDKDYLSILTKDNFYSINNLYDYLVNLFEENKVSIKKIILKKEFILFFKFNDKNEKEITLIYNKENTIKNHFLLNKINELKTEFNNLKIENNKLKEEIEILKEFHYEKRPKEIKLLHNLTKNSYSDYGLDNTFTIFKSINDILYLIYSNKNKSIICYDLFRENIITELKYCHDENITNFKHYLDEINKRDIIMSISNEDNNIKLWNANNWDCILNIQNVNTYGHLYSACFLKDNNNNYIVSSNYSEVDDCEFIKIFDFQGNKIKEINNSNEITFFIDSYYDKIFYKNYIITGNLNYIKTYNYNQNKLYRLYDDKGKGYHFSIIVINNEEVLKLIESCEDGHIRIWHFHSGSLLKKIKVTDDILNGICLYNNNYLFVGCDDNTIKLLDLKNGTVLEYLYGHNKEVLNIIKIKHPKYGECIISQGYEDDQIKIWEIK